MTSFLVEMSCPEHGLERFKIKIIKKYNVAPQAVLLRFRSRPKSNLSGVVVGRSVHETEVRDCLLKYFKDTGMIDLIISMKLAR